MNGYELSGKDKEKLLSQVLEENNLEESEILYRIENKKGGLFKGATLLYMFINLKI